MLEGENIILRLFEEEDLEEFVTLYNRYAERGAFYPISFRSLTEYRNSFREKGWWEEDEGRMLITDKNDRMLGTIFFFKGARFQEGYEVGYTLFRQEDRGRGIVSEALPIFSAYLFALKPIPRLCLHTAPGNAASQRVAEKAGYKHEGTLRQSFFLRGTTVDCELYSLLRDECPPLEDVLKR
jgi:RimJ/RimL family protein N-acetyltransferase